MCTTPAPTSHRSHFLLLSLPLTEIGPPPAGSYAQAITPIKQASVYKFLRKNYTTTHTTIQTTAGVCKTCPNDIHTTTYTTIDFA